MAPPTIFKLDKKRTVIVLEERHHPEDAEADTFQLYDAVAEWKQGRLNDLQHYIGLLSVNKRNGEILFTPGNDTLSAPDISAIVDFIKKK